MTIMSTLGGEAGARDAGRLRLEGKEYVVADGDVMHFRFRDLTDRDGVVSRMRAFEDFQVGEVIEAGPVTVTADAIKAFAARFDPQPMHLDEGATQNAVVDGLLASGLHVVCMLMRLLADGMLRDSTSMGSPGVDEVRYLAPVRPGDRLTLRLEIVDKRASKSRPEMGILNLRSHLVNQDGKPVLRLTGPMMLGRWQAATGADGPSP